MAVKGSSSVASGAGYPPSAEPKGDGEQVEDVPRLLKIAVAIGLNARALFLTARWIAGLFSKLKVARPPRR